MDNDFALLQEEIKNMNAIHTSWMEENDRRSKYFQKNYTNP